MLLNEFRRAQVFTGKPHRVAARAQVPGGFGRHVHRQSQAAVPALVFMPDAAVLDVLTENETGVQADDRDIVRPDFFR